LYLINKAMKSEIEIVLRGYKYNQLSAEGAMNHILKIINTEQWNYAFIGFILGMMFLKLLISLIG